MVITIIQHEQIGQRCITLTQVMHDGDIWNNVQVYELPENRLQSHVHYQRDRNYKDFDLAHGYFDIEVDAARAVIA